MQKLSTNIGGHRVDIIFEKNSQLPIVSLRLIFKVAGSIMDKKPGIAALAAAILNEGSKTLGVSEFSKQLEIKAIQLYAEAGFESFSIQINSLKEHFAFSLLMLKTLLSDVNLTDSTLNKLKTQALGEIAMNANDFDYRAKLALNKLLFSGSNLAYPSIGTKQSLEEITAEDVSEFIKTNLNIANLFIVLGGDVEVDCIDFNDILASLAYGKIRSYAHISTSNKKSRDFIVEQSEQAYIYFGSPYNVSKEDKFKATVATFILGSSGFGSRLMEEIRVKRGLAYSVGIYPMLNLSYRLAQGFLQTKNQSMNEAIELVLKEITKFVKKGVNSKELNAAKSFLLGSEPLSKETMFKRLLIAQNEYYFGYELGEFDKDLARISSLSLDELNDFIKSHDELLDQSFAVIYNEN